MNKRSRIVLFSVFALSVFGMNYLYRRKLVAIEPVPKRKDDIEEKSVSEVLQKKIQVEIDKAHDKMVALRTIFTEAEMRKALKKASYLDSNKLAFVDATDDGLIFDFKYPGPGLITQGFTGLKATWVLKGIPKFLEGAFNQAFEGLGLQALLTLTPGQEWIVKLLLLAKDRKEAKLSKKEFVIHFNLLMLRLVNTKSFTSFQAVVDSLAPPIRAMFDTIRIKGQTMGVFLDTYYQQFRKVAARRFSRKIIGTTLERDPDYKPNNTLLSDKHAQGVLRALLIKSLAFYSDLRLIFEQTPAGKKALGTKRAALKAAGALGAAPKAAARKKAFSAYNKVLVGFDKLKRFMVVELARIFKRLQNKKYKDKLKVLADPVLEGAGLEFDDLVDLLAEERKGPAAPELKSIDEMTPADVEPPDGMDDIELDEDFDVDEL